MIKNKIIIYIIYTIALGMFLFAISSCKNWEVVQELDVHIYHLQNTRSKKVEVIVTKDVLNVGKSYRLKSIKQIDINNPVIE